jgi:hypothetical protein
LADFYPRLRADSTTTSVGGVRFRSGEKMTGKGSDGNSGKGSDGNSRYGYRDEWSEL